MPVRGRPVIEHLLERLDAVGCDEVRIVTRADKSDLRAHVAGRDLTVVLGEPADVCASLLLGLTGLADDDVVLAGFPDTLWGPADGFARLVLELRREEPADVVLGLFEVPDVASADEVRVTGAGLVTSVVPKPLVSRPGLTWGIVAARRRVVSGLVDYAEPGDLWGALAAQGPGSVRGVLLGDDFLDVGTAAGLARLS